MATLSTVAVDFIANTAKFTQGLENAQSATKRWATNTKKETQAATDAFDGASKALDRFAKQILTVVSVQRVGALFAQAAKDVSALVDEAQKVGVAAKDFDVLTRAAEKNGTSIDTVKRSFIEIQKSINEARKGTKETSDAFKQLGLAYTLLEQQSPIEQFYAVADALNSIKNANDRAAIGTILLGKSYNELNPVLALGSQRIKELGSGGLTQKQLENVDKVSKAFEDLNRTLKTEIKKSLAEIAGLLTNIAKGATFIVENFGNIARVAAIAFSPVVLLKFSDYLFDIALKLLDVVKYIDEMKKVGEILGGVTVFTSLSDIIKVKLAPALATLIPLFRNLAIAITAAAAAASKFLIVIAALPIVMIATAEAMSIVLRITADMFELFAGEQSQTARELREYAKNYNKFSDDVVYAVNLVVGVEEENIKIIEATTDVQRALAEQTRKTTMTANEAALARQAAAEQLEREEKILAEVAKREQEISEQLFADLANRAKAIEESLMTPSQVYQAELDKAREVFQSGLISYETYQKRLEQIRKNAAKSTTDLIATPGEQVRRQILEFGRQYVEGIISLEEAQKAIQLTTANAGKGVTDFISTPIQKAKKQILDFSVAYVDGFATVEEVTAATNKVIKEMGQSVVDYIATPADEVRKRIANIVELYEAGFTTLEDSTAALAKASVELWEATNPKILEAFEFMSSFADQFARAIAEGQNFGDALKNVFKSILRDITALIIRTAILQGIMASIGFIGGTDAGAAFGRLTGLIPTTGPGRASGGAVMGGSPYRVGERGPETFVPSSNGYILPNDMQPGESTNVVQNIYVQTGVAQTVRAEMLQLLPRFKSEAMAGVLDAKQRGGSYAKGLSPV